MINKTIEFNTGNIIVDNKNIVFKSHNGFDKSQSLERIYFGAVNYEEYNYVKLSPFNYGLRFFIIGGLTSIVSLIIQAFNEISLLNAIYWLSVLLAVFGAFIALIDGVFDALFGTRIAKNICSNLFGVKGYKVNIQNTSGGDHVEFLINPDELEKAKELLKFKQNQESTKSELSISLQELNDMLELKKKGVLNDEEFTRLKNQLLNKQ